MEQFQATVLELIKHQMQRQQESEERYEKTQLAFQKIQEEHERKQLALTELIHKAILSNQKDSDRSIFSQSTIWSTIESFSYNPEEEKTFERYYHRYQDFYEVDCQTWTDEKKIRLLLRKLGTVEHNKFTDYILPKKTKELTFNETVELLKELFSPRLSLFHKRWKCLNIQKSEQEDYTTFASIVNKTCDDFRLSELSADNFKCIIFVLGLVSKKDNEMRRRILAKLESEQNMTLQKLADYCQQCVSIKQDSMNIEETAIANVRKVHGKTRFRSPLPERKWHPTRKTRFRSPSPERKWYPTTSRNRDFNNKKLPPSACYGCGQWHWYNECPYKNKTCRNCKKVGHKLTKCRKNSNKSRVNVTKSEEDQDRNIRKYLHVKMYNKKIRMQLDSGSDISIINTQTYKNLGKPTLLKSKKIARTVTGDKIKLEGEIWVNVTFNNKIKQMRIFVMKNTNNLFGTDAITKFNLWDMPINSFCNKISETKDNIKNIQAELKSAYPEVFTEGLGRCTRTSANIQLKKNVQPIFRKKRSIPFAALEKVDQELERLTKIGVISKTEYTDWSAPAVYVKKKSGDIRVCADFSTGLNDAIEEFHYPLPSPEEVFAKLNGGKIFSKIDLSDAYLQVPMDNESAKILCINTHKGLYKYERLPFGVKTAPAIFQKIMDTMLSGLDFTIAYLDDILVKSESIEEHKHHLHKVFKRIKSYGFKVKENKCEFLMEEIKYLGHIINKEGKKPDKNRATAIKDMPEPKDLKSLQSFLGLVSYYQDFIPDLHILRAPLNELLKKEKRWFWSKECEKAFKQIIEKLSSDLFLVHFDPKIDIIVASDASSHGVGACILHKWKDGEVRPIAHASRSLLPAERNYSQIEKEALAIIFAVTKFHRYLHGRKFTLQTDHKPLVSIFGSKKGLPTYTANRLLRWGTILLNYDFNIQYLSTHKIGHADGLSRLIPKATEPLEDTVIASLRAEEEIKENLADTIRELPVSLKDIKKEAQNDAYITEIKAKLVQKDKRSQKTFSLVDNILMYGERVVIPNTLHKRILKDFHTGHPGINRMKSLMRAYVYWKGMDNDVTTMVGRCKGCILASKSPNILHNPWPKTDKPWSRIHIDFAGPINKWHYLVIVDSYSKWPEVFQMKKPTSQKVIYKLHELFARFGVPDTIVSDNGTQFTSKDFADFCQNFQVEHVRIPPYHPRSNGLAERFVDTLKRALRKATGTPTRKALQLFLQVYRITPNKSAPTSLPPAEIMFSRKIRSAFDKLIPTNKVHIPTETVPKRKFHENEKVYFKNYKNNSSSWEPGVIQKRVGNMVYMVKGNKFTHKRHVNQIKKRSTVESEVTSQVEDELYELYDTFDLQVPQAEQTIRRSGRKRKAPQQLIMDPKRKKY